MLVFVFCALPSYKKKHSAQTILSIRVVDRLCANEQALSGYYQHDRSTYQ